MLLADRNVDLWRWDLYMKAYLADPRNGIPNNSRDRSSARGNLNKELLRPDMTWRVFLKAMNFLDLIRVSFTVKVQWKDGKVTEVTARLKDRVEVPHHLAGEPAATPAKLDPTDPRNRFRKDDRQMSLAMPGLGNAEDNDDEDDDDDDNVRDEVEELTSSHHDPFLARRTR
jgi:hypothetical protein